MTTSATEPLAGATTASSSPASPRNRLLPASAWWIICTCLAILEGFWFGTRRIVIFALAQAGMIVLLPSPW